MPRFPGTLALFLRATALSPLILALFRGTGPPFPLHRAWFLGTTAWFPGTAALFPPQFA